MFPIRIHPHLSTAMLGGLSPQQFMRRHWQRKPLLVRQAMPGIAPPVSRNELFALAARGDVESRLVVHRDGDWQLRHGPLPRSALPPLRQSGWTLLVQGLDLHVEAAHRLLSCFRFVPDARLDDLMISYASDEGGVGPHLDSYDVFLLQVHGRRRWRIGRVDEPQLLDGVPLKILAHFAAEQEWLLEPGDMLYLPPGIAHDGVADGECMTCSIGFRAASRDEFAREVLQRVVDAAAEDAADGTTAPPQYADRGSPAVVSPARIPLEMQQFAADAVTRLVGNPRTLACALGEWLSEPKAQVWFDEAPALAPQCAVQLDIRTRMMWDEWHVFINGECYRAAGRDARLMRRLADERRLGAADRLKLGADAAALLAEWGRAGWLHAEP